MNPQFETVQDQKQTEENGQRPPMGNLIEDVLEEPTSPEEDKLAEEALLIEEAPLKQPALPTQPQPLSPRPVATADRDDTTDSGHTMLGKCKTAGCGKPTWNG